MSLARPKSVDDFETGSRTDDAPDVIGEETPMSTDGFFRAFFAVPNPHFNAFFEATTGEGAKHPLEDLINEAASGVKPLKSSSAETNPAPADTPNSGIRSK